MPPFFSCVRNLNSSTTLWCMRLRVVRFYEVPVFHNKNQVASFEIVFHDKEKDRVHATIKSSALRVLKKKPKEGSIYAIKDFIVVENRMKYKTTSTEVKLIVMQKTKIEDIFDETFPKSMYNLITFSEIQQYKDSQQFMLFDIIGKVTRSQVQPTQTAKGKRFEFQLIDDMNNTLACTLWDDYSNTWIPFIDENPEENVLVIIQFGRISTFGDKVNLCNTFNVTKIHVNGKSDEFAAFSQKLIVAEVEKKSIATYESGPTFALLEDFKDGKVEVKNLAEITSLKERTSYWVHATILEIELSGEWCYLGCKQCSKKLDQVNGIYFCSKCVRPQQEGEYRYKIVVSAMDETGAIKFMLWDKECIQLIGKKAGDVLKENGEASDSIPMVIAEALLNRVGIFKVQVNEGDCFLEFVTYNVLRMTDDPTVLTIYKNKYAPVVHMSDIGIQLKDVGTSSVAEDEDEWADDREDITLQSLMVKGSEEFVGGKKRKKTTEKKSG